MQLHCSPFALKIALVCGLFAVLPALAERQTVTFPSGDGLTITADVYAPHKSPETPFLVLSHQARWSRGEFLRIAPWLNELGYNCMAIDLRAGKTILGITNETAHRAKQKDKDTYCCASQPDIVAAINYAREHHADGKLILLGSSFSASLALRIAGENPELVDGVAAFSPGEFFTSEDKRSDWTEQAAAKIKTIPTFIAWAANESDKWRDIAEAIKCKDLVVFVPESGGCHGARALWEESERSDEYRQALRAFLATHFPLSNVE